MASRLGIDSMQGSRLGSSDTSGSRLGFESGNLPPLPPSPSLGSLAWGFVKNLPSMIVQGAATKPVATIAQYGSTVGNFLAQKLPIRLQVSEATKTAARQFQTGFQKPIVAPHQTEPILPSTAPFKSFGEATGATAESALDLWLTMGTLGTGTVAKTIALQGVKGTVKQGVKTVVEQGAKKTTLSVAKQIIKDGLIGSGFNVAGTLQEENQTAKDYAISAGTGFLFGVALPPVLGKGLELGVRSIRGTGRLTTGILDEVASRLERRISSAEPTTGNLRPYQALDKPIDLARVSLSEKTLRAVNVVRDIPSNFAKFINEHSPVGLLDKQLREAGVDPTEVGAIRQGVQAQVEGTKYAGVGKVQDKLQYEVAPIIRKYGSDWILVAEHLDMLDRAARLKAGQIEIDPGRASSMNAEELDKAISDFYLSLTPEQLDRVHKGTTEIHAIYESALEDMQTSGFFSQEAVQRMHESNPNYIKSAVEDFINQEKPQATPKGVSVSSTGIKGAKGSKRKRLGVRDSLVLYIKDAYTRIENNKTARIVFDAGRKIAESRNKGKTADEIASQGVGEYTILRSAEDAKARSDLLKQLTDSSERRKAEIEGLKKTKGIGQDLWSKYNALSEKIAKFQDLVDSQEQSIAPSGDIYETMQRASKTEQLLHDTIDKGKLNDVAQHELSANIESLSSDISKIVDDMTIHADIKIKAVDYEKMGLDIISSFKDGYREDMLVQKDMAEALKGMNDQETRAFLNWLNENPWGKLASTPATIIRFASVIWNPTFGTISNPTRDFQTGYAFKNVGLRGWVTSLWKTIGIGGSHAEETRLFKSVGSTQASFTRQEKTLGLGVEVKFSKNPLDWITGAADKMETASRRAAWDQATLKGYTPREAAYEAINSTVDFGKSSPLLRVINKLVPFFNPAVQGGVNIAKAAVDDPYGLTRRLMISAAYPTVLIEAHNSRYASSGDIPESDKLKYWTIMVGESSGFDAGGKRVTVPHYIKVPKGEFQKPVANAIQLGLDVAKGKNPDLTHSFFGQFIADVSPVTEASLVPPGIGTVVELMTNYSVFRQQKIVPDYIYIEGKPFKSSELIDTVVNGEKVHLTKMQYTPSTSELAKFIGAQLNWSPIKIDYVIKNGVLNDLLRSIDIATGRGVKGESNFEKASNAPFSRTFFGSSTYGAKEQKTSTDLQKAVEQNKTKIDRLLNRKDMKDLTTNRPGSRL